MKSLWHLSIPICVLMTLGCTAGVVPVAAPSTFWNSKEATIGVGMTELPRAIREGSWCGEGTSFGPGLSETVTAAQLAGQLETYLSTLDISSFKQVLQMFKVRLTQYGFKATVLDAAVRKHLPKFDAPGGDVAYAPKDYRSLKAKLGVDRLLVIEVLRVGTTRDCGQGIVQPPPAAVLFTSGLLVDLTDNRALWRSTQSDERTAVEPWAQPPSFPNLTQTLTKTMDEVKANLVTDFFLAAPSPAPPLISAFVTTIFPEDFAGFTFGSTSAIAQRACADAGQTWKEQEGSFVCGAPVKPLEFASPVLLRFCGDKLCAADVVARPPKDDGALAQYREMEAKLEHQYGPANSKTSQIPSDCSVDVVPCILKGTAAMKTYWIWSTGRSISLKWASSTIPWVSASDMSYRRKVRLAYDPGTVQGKQECTLTTAIVSDLTMTKPSKLCFVLMLAALLCGCASYDRIADYPIRNQPTNIAVTVGPISGWSDLPLGTYYDEKRHIIVRGAQGDGANFGAAFGLIALVAMASEDQAGKSSAQSQLNAPASSSTVNLVTMTNEALDEAIAYQIAPQWTRSDAAVKLKVSSYAVFTVLSSGKACLHAMLRAEIPGPGGDPKWWVRYFARAPGEYTIEGTDGWMAQNRFVYGMGFALRRTVQASIDDAHGRLTLSRKVNAKGQFPYIKDRSGELPVIIVQENKDTVVARMVLFDNNALSGTHVLNRAEFALTDTEFSDPRH